MAKMVELSARIRQIGLDYFSHIGRYTFLIYIIVFLSSLLLLLPAASFHAKNVSEQSLQRVESELDAIKHNLWYLISDKHKGASCQEMLVELRKSVFRSDFVKEIGVVSPSGEVFCTSNSGDASFHLYKAIIARLDENPNNHTLSYTKSKFSKEKTVVLVFTTSTGEGLSILIPPRYILGLVKQQLDSDGLDFNVSIISKALLPKNQGKPIDTMVQRSERYPLAVQVETSAKYYAKYVLYKSWIGLVIASIIAVYIAYWVQQRSASNSLESALQHALDYDYLETHFQPIIDQASGRVVGCESLLRWKDPKQGYIPPGTFIPLAEKVGLIEDLTCFVLYQVREMLESHESAFEERYVSINISRSVILKPSFIGTLVMFCDNYPYVAEKLVFEITEDNSFDQAELVVMKRHLDIISSYGIRVAIDDFGTGYSGLDFVRQFPFRFVKIDKIFIKNLYSDSTIIPLLQSMLDIANNLNMEVIVEGVEEKSQLDILHNLGFKYIQGFYFSKPISKAQLIEFINQPSIRPEIA